MKTSHPIRLNQAFVILLLTALLAAATRSADAFTAADATAIWNNFNKAFYIANGGKAYYSITQGGDKLTFWQQAETIEMACDREDASHSASDKAFITALCNGFIANYGTDWTEATTFNDDVMWACIAFSRAYYCTSNRAFATRAAANFKYVYNGGGHRASPQHDNALGGGMWWTTNHSSTGSKNACVNGPGALAGFYLYQIYGKSGGFLEQARNMFDWEKAHLFEASTGKVYDHENANGRISHRPFTYNQGTFLGAAHFLGDDASARAAALYTMSNMCSAGILPQYTPASDSAGFNGIFLRWLARYMNETGTQNTYNTWLYHNANTAWKIRNAEGLSWCNWLTQTPARGNDSWSCSDAIVIMQILPPQ